MAFWIKNEIDKIKAKYGETKGRQFLTYFYTFTKKTVALMQSNNDGADEIAANVIASILERHGQAYLNEYNSFFKANIQNAKLLTELAKSGSTYIDDSITVRKQVAAKPAHSKPVQKNPTSKTATAKPIDALGRDESKHISCKYDGHEDDCPDDCAKCAISIKTDGDIALASNRPDEAIRQYKKAVFVSPKFAEAWVNLGNAYGMKSEYNNALSAFNKAIAIDPIYGKALFGKAITLRNLKMFDEAMEIANTILSLYDDANVRKFKQDLICAGVKDKSSIVDAKKAKTALAGKAGEVMRNNDLLGDDGAAEVIPEIYQPEEFTKAVLSYCKRKYVSLGEKKIRGECIITSFYGSICAVVLHQRDPNGMRNCNVFSYLSDHLDVEFTDVNAERLLGTKAGEEKAEAIWSLLSPYLSLTQTVFDAVDELTDEIMLEAMKHSYVLGMLVAKYYTSEKRKRHVLGSRAEIDQALKRLAASTKDYQNPPQERAMCYSIRTPEEVCISFRCSKCGHMASLTVYEGSEHIYEQYRKLTGEFTALGHKAEVMCLCDSCAEQYFPSHSSWSKHNIVFAFTAKGSTTPVYSYPSTWRYNDFEYKVALEFLKGAGTINELSEVTQSKLDSDVYLKHIHNVIGDGK